MSNLTLILLAAGSSSRFSSDVKKQWLRVGHLPLWQFVANNLANKYNFQKIIIVGSSQDIEFMKNYTSEYNFVTGGATRQESLRNALVDVDTPYTLVSDVARGCITQKLLNTIIGAKEQGDVVVPYLRVSDTIVYNDQTIDRDAVKRIQTPQLSKTDLLRKALQTDIEYTDESSAMVAIGAKRVFVEGDEDAHKITYIQDLNKLPCLQPPSSDILSGNGFDVHEFDTQGKMYLCGIHIDNVSYGFKAHSDGDVAIHALIDALLGATGLGDIGMLFPDNDPQYKGIDSKTLLKEVYAKIIQYGFTIINIDITIAAQQPRLAHYKDAMRTKLAEILSLEKARVNVKATTTEKLGFVGRKEGVAVIANANVKYFNWKDEQ